MVAEETERKETDEKVQVGIYVAISCKFESELSLFLKLNCAKWYWVDGLLSDMATGEKMMLEEGLQRGAMHEVMTVVMLVVAVGVVTLCRPPMKGLHTWLLTVRRYVCT